MFSRIAFVFLLSIMFCSACVASEAPAAAGTSVPSPTTVPVESPAPVITSASTMTPAPSSGEVWSGTWTVWIGEGADQEMLNVFFEGNGNEITAVVEGEQFSGLTFNAVVSTDGVAALGDWQSDSGRSGALSMVMNAEHTQFAGSMHGLASFCGSRESISRPNPCESVFGSGWGGEWTMWIGPDEAETLMVLEQTGNTVRTLLYDIEGTLSDDGTAISGSWSAFGSSGVLEAKLLSNQAQFQGNLNGLFPLCGARPGASKPQPCMELK